MYLYIYVFIDLCIYAYLETHMANLHIKMHVYSSLYNYRQKMECNRQLAYGTSPARRGDDLSYWTVASSSWLPCTWRWQGSPTETDRNKFIIAFCPDSSCIFYFFVLVRPYQFWKPFGPRRWIRMVWSEIRGSSPNLDDCSLFSPLKMPW